MRLSDSRTSAIPVGAEWNACWNRRRACSSASEVRSRSPMSRRIDDGASHRRPHRSASSPRQAGRAVRPMSSEPIDPRRLSAVGAASTDDATIGDVVAVVVRRRIRERTDRSTRRRSPVSSAARPLADAIAPSASRLSTASGSRQATGGTGRPVAAASSPTRAAPAHPACFDQRATAICQHSRRRRLRHHDDPA